MMQRVAIARALAVDPDILLMDEPFAALDSQYRNYLRHGLERIWLENKKTIIFVTHSITEAICLADTIYLLSARPAQVRKVFRVDLPRPRDYTTPGFVKLREKIEEETYIEFEKMLANQRDQELDGVALTKTVDLKL
jgi:NitT/TauT family transport system ATP-binding protein